MRKMLIWSCVVALGLFFCLAGSASAVPTDFGGTGEVNEQYFTLVSGMGYYWSSPAPATDNHPSWYSGPYPQTITFTNFDTYITGQETFTGNATIGYGNFSSKGWTGTKTSDTTSHASGPAITTPTTVLQWNYDLYLASGDLNDKYPITININYFNGNNFLGHERYVITSYQQYDHGQNISYFDMTQYNHTPLPPSVLLLGSGLIGLGVLGWRRQVS